MYCVLCSVYNLGEVHEEPWWAYLGPGTVRQLGQHRGVGGEKTNIGIGTRITPSPLPSLESRAHIRLIAC